MIERASVCTLDCPDTCSLTVTVDAGRIVKVRGSQALPYTDGVICNKVAQRSVDFVHGPNRLRHPLRRTGPRGSGQFARISNRRLRQLRRQGQLSTFDEILDQLPLL